MNLEQSGVNSTSDVASLEGTMKNIQLVSPPDRKGSIRTKRGMSNKAASILSPTRRETGLSISKSIAKQANSASPKECEDEEGIITKPPKTYTRMMADLQFPPNPAFYKSGPGTKATPSRETKEMKESFLEICR